MSDPDTPNQPLIGAPSQQTVVDVGAPAQGGRSTRAYKVAGLTLLACVLIMSQAMIAYFLLSQRSDIKSLEEQSNNLKTELTRGRSVSVPMKMHVPMNALPMLMDDSVDEESSTVLQEKLFLSRPPTASWRLLVCLLCRCQVSTPDCDERGLYRPQQCFMHQCWCVNPATGEQIPGSLRSGRAKCGATALIGSRSNVLTLPDVAV